MENRTNFTIFKAREGPYMISYHNNHSSQDESGGISKELDAVSVYSGSLDNSEKQLTRLNNYLFRASYSGMFNPHELEFFLRKGVILQSSKLYQLSQ